MQSLHRSLKTIVLLHDYLQRQAIHDDAEDLLPLCDRALEAVARALSDLTGTLVTFTARTVGAGLSEASDCQPEPAELTHDLERMSVARSSPGGQDRSGLAPFVTDGSDGGRLAPALSEKTISAGGTGQPHWVIIRLTPRERRIAKLVIAGYTNKKIATVLGISQRTVEHHRRAAMQKSGAKSVCELVRIGIAAASPASNFGLHVRLGADGSGPIGALG